ncbi:hypothetical protein [Lysobacter sp. TY2-98]|uniref:hypothetical protein n=1 Tax=Lysobacter sp. TY2-98 TaxID=2290922 RepID=UPI0013B384A0|nr:hypothetical protein [Lysobacter sp. TY2-98]
MKSIAALALLAIGVAPAAHAAGRCLTVVDSVNFYHSATFPYDLPADQDPLFASLDDTPQARDFEAYVRRTYGVSGKIETSCRIALDNEMEMEGDHTMGTVTFHHVQTRYVPQAR